MLEFVTSHIDEIAAYAVIVCVIAIGVLSTLAAGSAEYDNIVDGDF